MRFNLFNLFNLLKPGSQRGCLIKVTKCQKCYKEQNLDWGGVASWTKSEHRPLPTLIRTRRLTLDWGLRLDNDFKIPDF